MRRILLPASLLVALGVLLPLPADAATVQQPNDGDPYFVGDSVLISGTKEAGEDIRFWDGEAASGCFPQPITAAAGDWQCQISGPFRPGSYPWEARVYDGETLTATLPMGFTVQTRLRVDMASLKVVAGKPIVVTGTADPGEELTASITRMSDTAVKQDLTCTTNQDTAAFRCVEPRTRTAAHLRRAALPAGNDYVLTLTETNVEIGVIAGLQQEFQVLTPNLPPDPDPDPVPDPDPEPEPTPPGDPDPPVVVDDPSPPATPDPTPGPPPVTPPLPLPPTDLPVDPPVAAPPVIDVVDVVPGPGPDLSLLVGLFIAAFTALSIAGGRGFAVLRLVTTDAVLPTPRLPVITDAGSEDDDLGRETEHRKVAGWGDRSATWRLPGHHVTDRVGLLQPRRIAPWSPLVGRLLADAGYLRSMVGALWLVPLLGAVCVAGAALGQTSAAPLPPAVGLVVAVILLACLDALAGALAVLILWTGVVVTGGLGDPGRPDLSGSVAVLLVLGILWMALPLIGSATRPFRRRSGPDRDEPGRSYRWDRLADVAIAAPLCGWIAYKLTQALAPFAGRDLAISDHATLIGVTTAGGILFRFVLEEVAEHGYPLRLREVEAPGSLPDPTRWTDLGGALLRSAVLCLLAYVFLGSCWQLWVGTAIVGGLQVLAVFDDLLPKSPRLGKVLPRGITKPLVMLLIGTVVAAWATDGRVGMDQLRDCFVIMAVPSAVLAGLKLFAESPEPRPWNWPQQLAGAAVYVTFVVLVVTGW